MRSSSQFVFQVAAITLITCIVLAFISSQYAKAVGAHKLAFAPNSGERHRVTSLMEARYYKGDMVNSFQSSQFSVTILCPLELALLTRQIARAIYLSGFVAGLYAVVSALVALRRTASGAIRELLKGATIFGFTAIMPDVICAVSKWSNGYAPF